MQIKAAGIGAFGNMHRFFGKFLPKGGAVQYAHLFDTGKTSPEISLARACWKKHGAHTVPRGDYKALTTGVHLVTICVGKHSEAVQIYPALVNAWERLDDFPPTIIDFSTYSVRGTSIIHEFCHNHGIRWANMPLSGGPVGAEQGSMIMMYGGSEALYHTFLPILFEKVGKPFFTGEDVNAGAKVKMMNQCMIFGQLEGLARAIAMDAFAFRQNTFGNAQQIQLFDQLNLGAGGGNQWNKVFVPALRDNTWTHTGFLNAHAAVDSIYAADFAIECGLSKFGVILPLLTTAASLGFAMKLFGVQSITQTIAKALLSTHQSELDTYLEAIGYFSEPNMARAVDLVAASLPEASAKSVLAHLTLDDFKL